MTASAIDVRGLCVLVTGSTRGIGRAFAAAFAAAGAQVIVTGRDAQAAQRVSSEIGAGAIGFGLDVSLEASVASLAAQLRERDVSLDVLVNNAGIDPHYADLRDTTTDMWERIRQTNLDGVFYCCRHLAAPMAERGRGCVINVSSVGGSVALRKQVPYCAAKGGVDQITRALAVDWANVGVRVNGIGYGFIETDLTSGMRDHPHIAPKLLARTPMGRFGTLDEVAGAALFLASPAASFITGHTLMVDGGWTAA